MERRQLLRAAALATLTGIAGCTDGADGTGGTRTSYPTGSPSATGSPTENPKATRTSTATEDSIPTREPTEAPTEREPQEATETATPEPTDTGTPESTEPEPAEPTETGTPEQTEVETREPTETATPEPTETETPEPTDTETPTATPCPNRRLASRDFRVLDEGCGTQGNSATVRRRNDTVRVTGTIDGGGTCYTADLDSARYDAGNDRLSVAVITRKDQDTGSTCGSCISEIEYETTIRFDCGTPSEVRVTHDGERVRT